MPAGQQRAFEDARGFVINDYQGILEQKWLSTLKTRYPVIINKAVLNKMLTE
jgi:peptidyl-prolyl cis-trans isomerase SurA